MKAKFEKLGQLALAVVWVLCTPCLQVLLLLQSSSMEEVEIWFLHLVTCVHCKVRVLCLLPDSVDGVPNFHLVFM